MRKKAIPLTDYKEDPFKALAAAIVRQAVIDDYEYRRMKHIWEKRGGRSGNSEVKYYRNLLKSTRDFFCGQYFQLLMNADGRQIYRQMEANFNMGRKPLLNYRSDRQ